MGVLDDLQAEIDNKRAAEQLHAKEQREQQAYYEESLRPRMARAYQFLAQLVEKLNTVAPDIRPAFPFNPLGGGDLQMQQGDYKFRVDDGENPRQVDVICSCTLERPQEYHLPTADSAERFGRLLDSYRMVYHRKEFRDKYQNIHSATFLLEGPLRVHIRVTASDKERCIFVDLRNLEAKPVKRYQLEPQQLDAALLDRLGRILLRQESYLITTKVDEGARRKLQQTLEKERLQQESVSGGDEQSGKRRGALARLFRRS